MFIINCDSNLNSRNKTYGRLISRIIGSNIGTISIKIESPIATNKAVAVKAKIKNFLSSG